MSDKKNLYLVIFLCGCFVISYLPVWKKLFINWYSSDDYSHGFFILPICAYILWSKKDRFKTIPIEQSWLGFFIAVGSLMVFLFSFYAEISTLASLSLVSFIAGAIYYLFGFNILKECAFPLFILLFMIPIPAQIYSQLTIPLQLLVSKISTGFVSIVGIPIYREGNVIHLPGRTLAVVQACSGLRSLMSLLTLSAVFSYFTLNSTVLRSLLFISGVPAAILVNIFRVVLIIFAFQYFEFDLTKGKIHTVFGVIIFVIAVVIVAATRSALLKWDKDSA